jgi:hypothetical protein
MPLQGLDRPTHLISVSPYINNIEEGIFQPQRLTFRTEEPQDYTVSQGIQIKEPANSLHDGRMVEEKLGEGAKGLGHRLPLSQSLEPVAVISDQYSVIRKRFNLPQALATVH